MYEDTSGSVCHKPRATHASLKVTGARLGGQFEMGGHQGQRRTPGKKAEQELNVKDSLHFLTLNVVGAP